jgi:hypothetical protein
LPRGANFLALLQAVFGWRAYTVVRCFPSCVDAGEKYRQITVAEHYHGNLMKASHRRLDAKAEDALANS